MCGVPIKQRFVLIDTLVVMGFRLLPAAPSVFRYDLLAEMSSETFAERLIDVVPPVVAGVRVDSVDIVWHGVGRAGGDSVVLIQGADLEIPIVSGKGASTPEPQDRRWSFRLTGDAATIEISGMGTPPDTLVIPHELFPATSSGMLDAGFTYSQGRLDDRLQNDLLALDLWLDVRLSWVVLLASSG